MNEPLYIDIHMLQSVPPSNINRDDTGSPKTARFGGVQRSRVSSQAWKKAARDLFPDYLDESEIGQRTKHAVDAIATIVKEKRPDIDDSQAVKVSSEALSAAGIKIKDNDTGYLLFIAPRQAEELARIAVGSLGNGPAIDKRQARTILDVKQNPVLNAIDIALFGRMVADAPDLNVDAAVQVAHAISVGKAETEFDYFTALDDRAPEDNAGAAMIETTEFTSSTLYRYADIDVLHLCENLGSANAACKGIDAFLRAFVRSMPTGKQNSFANRTLPSAIVVQLRGMQPVSLVNAFERPVASENGKGQMGVACERLVEQEKAIDNAFGSAPSRSFVVCASSDAEPIKRFPNAEVVNFDELVSRVTSACAEYLVARGYQPETEE